jgi:hypothetical protein
MSQTQLLISPGDFAILVSLVEKKSQAGLHLLPSTPYNLISQQLCFRIQVYSTYFALL